MSGCNIISHVHQTWSNMVWIVFILAITVNAVVVKDVYLNNTRNTDLLKEPDDGADDSNPDEDDFEEAETEKPKPVTVSTTHGYVRGHIRNDNNIKVLSFIDIPYGQFTKFEAPKHADTWSDVHDVTEHTIRCPQLDESNENIGSDDCLVLSVFTPAETTVSDGQSSVLFHIHDGNFVHGSGDYNIYGPEYLVEKGIILVLPNYRLGPLGFLCLQDEVVPGNAALKDLTLALQWVKHNIANFGGSPEKITVSAEGKAGALVGLLALSPKSNKLFKQAITESGAMLAPWALDRNPTDTGLKLLKSVSETTNTSSLLKIDILKIMQAAKQEIITFKPCVEKGEDSFISSTPWNIINKDGFATNISFMMGSADMSGMQKTMKLSMENLEELNNNIQLLIPQDLSFKNNASGKVIVAKKIKELYFKDKNISDETRQELTVLFTDSEYLGPSLRLARALSKAGGEIYLYEFACDSERNVNKIALNISMPGAARGDIVGYVFMQKEKLPKDKQNLSPVLLLDFWVSFISDGVPTADSLSWKPLTDEEESVMMINTDPKLENYIHPNRMNIWTKIYDRHFIEHSSAPTPLPSHIILGLFYITLYLF